MTKTLNKQFCLGHFITIATGTFANLCGHLTIKESSNCTAEQKFNGQHLLSHQLTIKSALRHWSTAGAKFPRHLAWAKGNWNSQSQINIDFKSYQHNAGKQCRSENKLQPGHRLSTLLLARWFRSSHDRSPSCLAFPQERPHMQQKCPDHSVLKQTTTQTCFHHYTLRCAVSCLRDMHTTSGRGSSHGLLSTRRTAAISVSAHYHSEIYKASSPCHIHQYIRTTALI